ncbi:hypothetical protein [Cohnella hashimotonis]|uniref:Holin n=1 Tax=Cohnella hashimotonis TaxID=2826895 RepID=A0ABT6TKP3_9BACL|nr:hypothetical protein [Cohnella hashimotonis]MDI4647400.1 hypothetical protein [Cohnella hashimotonis]
MTTDALFTWNALGTLTGAALFTFLVVQYTKSLVDRWLPGLPTDVYAILVGWAILALAQVASGASPVDWRLYLLSGANGLLVALAAGQMHNKVVSELGAGEPEPNNKSIPS